MDQIDDIMKALVRTAERVVTKVSLDITSNLTAAASEGGTPVDTGWASANWIPAIGKASRSVGGGRGADRDKQGRFKSKGSKRNEGEIAGAQAAGAAGQARLLGYRLNQGNVFVSDNVPYIGALNNGHSQQAPSSFIERAIEKALTQDLRGLSR